MIANLAGVWAKWQRAVEQMETLDKEVAAFCEDPNPYGMLATVDREQGRYRFEIRPRWQAGIPLRWGAIIGEIVHDFRSALDQLVWQLVLLNGQQPDKRHYFPILKEEPEDGFVTAMRRTGGGRRGALRGTSDEAIAVIEAAQPYNRADGVLLLRLHRFWNLDKHQLLLPVHFMTPRPRLIPENIDVLKREDRLENDVYIVQVQTHPGTRVDIEPQPPTDITFGESHPIVLELKHLGQVIITGILIPASELFPDLTGLGTPDPTRRP
jgi:hypothetical protein